MIGPSTHLWRHLFATGCLWQQIGLISSRAYGQLKVSSSQFYFVGTEASPNYHLHMVKITYGSSVTDWSNRIDWTGGICDVSYSGSLLSRDSTAIYSFFPFGVTGNQYLYFVTLNSSDGSVLGSRYISSLKSTCVYGITLADDFIAVNFCYSSYAIMLYNTVTSQFTYRKFIDFIFQITTDSVYGR